MKSGDVPVCTARYVRNHSKSPDGSQQWAFMLVSPSATIADHVFYSKPGTAFKAALAEAQVLARLRRADEIVVLP